MCTATRRTSVIWLFLFSLLGVASHSQAQDLFDPVYATMTQQTGDVDSPGCRGCHIGPMSAYGPWFGDEKADVLDFFLNGEGMYMVEGGRRGTLADALGLVDGHEPYMPFGAPFSGRFWEDNPCLGRTELTDLGIWLDSLGGGSPIDVAVSSQ